MLDLVTFECKTQNVFTSSERHTVHDTLHEVYVKINNKLFKIQLK